MKHYPVGIRPRTVAGPPLPVAVTASARSNTSPAWPQQPLSKPLVRVFPGHAEVTMTDMAPGRHRTDPGDLDALGADVSEDERLVQQKVRDFVHDQVLPSIEDWFEERTFPRHLVPALGQLGVLGMHLRGYGCANSGAVSYGLACLELEAGDSALRSFVSVQSSLAMFAIWKFGSEEQKQRYLPAMAAGEMIGCFGLTEPEAGSDPSSMRARATRDGSDWVLDGHKRWMTNGSIADVAVIWAKAEEGVRGFLVPRQTPGFSTRDIEGKWSLRASVSSEAILDACRLPEEAVLPGALGLRARFRVSTKLAMALCGEPWGPPVPVMRPPSRFLSSGCSLASR